MLYCNATLSGLVICLAGQPFLWGNDRPGETNRTEQTSTQGAMTVVRPSVGPEYQYHPIVSPASQPIQHATGPARSDVEYTFPPYEKSYSLPPIPNRRRRSLQESQRSNRTTQGVIHRMGLTPVSSAGFQQTDKSAETQASPYDDVFLIPPPKANNSGSSTAPDPSANQSAPDELLLNDDDDLLTAPSKPDSKPQSSPSDKNPSRNPAEIEDLSGRDLDLLNGNRPGVTPYQPPSLKSQSERVVPLPVVPAPADFPGYLPPNPDGDTLPGPRRTFDLPKQEVVVPQQVVPQQVVPSDDSSIAMPWHNEGVHQGNGMQPLFESQTGAATPYHVAGYRQEYRDHTEQYKKRPPLTTLPERLKSRHYQFRIHSYMPSSTSPVPLMSDSACQVELQESDFAPNPQVPKPLNPATEIETYYGKSMVETQRPWVEWWRPFYTGGMYEPGIPVFSDVNLLTPSFLVYGDYRTAVGIHRFGGKPSRQWAHRLNLDMDLRLTGTERFHMFTGPMDDNGRFTRLDFSDSDNVEFEEELDFRPDTAFFEGDLGAITGSWLGTDAPFDLPFTMGIIPLLYQNGIWMEDAIAGFAVGSPWRHSRPFNWDNFETTFFVGFADVNSPAFQDQNAAKVFGTAWFIEAYGGYIEADYAYLDERQDLGRSYHNAAIAFTRRYFGRISNSVRLIGNAGQRGSRIDRTADGALLLFENSLITSQPSNFVPYFNAFLGNGRPQSVARAGGSGEILRNTGINFESDGLTAYPTLNATGANAYGAALGFNLLSADFRQQFVAEFAALDRYGNPALSGLAGPQYAIGARYQKALNNWTLIRFDAINGWLDNASNIYGMRSEFRWKF